MCTRVSKSTQEDWAKLRRVLAFLQHTIDDIRVIGAHSLQDIYTWIDSAYGVHNVDLRSHTGGSMSMGTGTIHTRSTKQKLNVKSSTEAELVGTSEYMPYNVWIRNFFGAQGYDIQDNILFQDNQSAIKMEVNGRRSCTGNSCHINIRHFFVKDMVDKKLVKVLYCPTDKMLADFFTKPLQGSLFRFFRDIIMGYTSITDILDDHPKIKERVENWKKYKHEMFSHIEDNTSTPKKVSFAKAGVSNDVVVHTPQSKNKYVHSQYENVESIQPTYAQVVKQKT